MRIAIIGGGAAGFFSAIAAKENYSDAMVIIFEKSQELLSKVKISGGTRCNVTNSCNSVDELCKAYPRGGKALKGMFYIFNTKHTIEWFKSKGVMLKTESDGRVFPASQNSQSIIDCFFKETKRLDIKIKTGMKISAVKQKNNLLELNFENKELKSEMFDKVIIATGGSPKKSGLEWLEILNHKIENPVPSLFTFNMPTEQITGLKGVVAENTFVKIKGTLLKSEGPLLITHWGLSGPVILKLSSFGARILNELNYNFKVQINWVNERNSDVLQKKLEFLAVENPHKLICNCTSFHLPLRLWSYLVEKSGIPTNKKCVEIGRNQLNKLVNVLTNDEYTVIGKTTFKEEFVTCGGVSLQSIDINTMQSKVCKNLYFAGEILDIDGITGGFNFQAAWTTGFIAGKLI